MIVVAIVGVLATLAVYGVRKYLASAKTAEAVEMLGVIRAAQEAYMGETFAYKDVSGENKLDGSGTSFPKFYPSTSPLQREKMAWGAGTDAVAQGWRELGVSPSAPVYFIYGAAAGSGSQVPAPLNCSCGISGYPSGANGVPWYLTKAVSDLDGDGIPGQWVSSNFFPEIGTDNAL